MDFPDELVAVLDRSRSLGLLGPGPVRAHLQHALGFVRLLDGSETVLDLGAGGGVPGLVVAALRPPSEQDPSRSIEPELVLLDASERRVAFLRFALRSLGSGPGVRVELGRAEVLARHDDLREHFDVVISRSFGSPAVTAECATGFLKPGGRLLVSEPESTPHRWPAESLVDLALEPGVLHESPHSRIRELKRLDHAIPTVPRPVGVPARRPLF